ELRGDDEPSPHLLVELAGGVEDDREDRLAVPDAWWRPEELVEADHRDLLGAAGAVDGQGGVDGLHDLAAADTQRLVGRLGVGLGTVVSGPKARKTTQPRRAGY